MTTTKSSSPDTLVLHRYTEDVYLEYAVATVKGRALAQVQDGLKPVQRRILHTMRALGLTGTARPVKSARVVGDVLGKYHPHGDQAAYDAMVRMAQDFSLRYPLIVGQGNFGSRDGDSAAAMRYTEAKLSPYAELLLSELGRGTVDFTDNYDGTLKEPVLMPARLPMLLLNGTMGIAVGMAADIPSHNLREVANAAVAVLRQPDITVAELMQHLPGPDFPGGAMLTSTPSEIEQVYKTGRGSFRCRAKVVKEDLARGQWQLVVTELPYQISTRQILEELDTLTNPQPPAGKKALTQQQIQTKQLALDMLEKAVDESDKNSAVRIVLSPRSSKVDVGQLQAFLFGATSLECNISMNTTLIGLDGRPQTKSLLDVLREWVVFRTETVRRRTHWELDGALSRLHILEGRLTVYLNLDKVIALIRSAEDPKAGLMSQFGLSADQAEDILEMRLRQLNRLEGLRIEKEIEELKALSDKLRALLANPKELARLMEKEIKADAQQYGDDRRTVLSPKEKSVVAHAGPRVLDEPLTVVLSQNRWIRAYKGHDLEESAFLFKPADALAHKVQTRSTATVWLLDSKGRAYSLESHAVPAVRGEGAPLSTLVDVQPGAEIVALLAGVPEDQYLFSADNGYGYLAPLKSLTSRQKAGKAFLAVEEGAQALPPLRLPLSGNPLLALRSSEGRVLVFDAKEIKTLASGGKGVQLMALPDNTKVMWARWASANGATLHHPAHGRKKAHTQALQGDDWLKWVARRARKGQPLALDVQIELNSAHETTPDQKA